MFAICKIAFPLNFKISFLISLTDDKPNFVVCSLIQRVYSLMKQLGLWTDLLLLFSCSVMFDSLQPHGLQNAKLPCPSPSLGVCSNSGDAIQSSCPLSSPSPPAFNLSRHQVANVWELQLQHQSSQCIFSIDFL